jgi:hypothetical protein
MYNFMRIELDRPVCENPSYFSEVLAPAVDEQLPSRGSLAAKIIDHTTAVRPFFDTVSRELCSSEARISGESAKRALGFVTRSTASAVVIGGVISAASLGLAVGSPFMALGVGAVALGVLPPLAEQAAFRVVGFAERLLKGISER